MSISVLTPSYNSAPTLSLAAMSTLRSSLTEDEFVVTNDVSTDRTEKLVRSFIGQKLKRVRNNGETGWSVAQNLGLRKAQGEFIAGIYADDIFALAFSGGPK